VKAFLRSRPVQHLMATLIAAWLRLCRDTLRWTVEGQDKAQAVWDSEGGAIFCVWHATGPLGPACWPQGPGRQEMRCLISRSSDGEFMALTMNKIGYPAIRGSSQKASDKAKNKSGERAFRDMVRWVKDGGAVSITPDGPRGPVEVMQPGAPTLARMTGAPVILCGLSSKPQIRVGSWDRTIIPLPFARAAMVWDGPYHAGRDDDLEALAGEWGARLSAASRRAEAILDAAAGE
jgi:lysophospholipid acyltransferase (LPLAT)-like uncharacterized protein